MKRHIERELLQLGAPTGRLGYMQMVHTLELIMQNERVTSTTNVLYPKVADRLETKPTRIERNLREEIKALWTYGDQNKLDALFVNRGKYPPARAPSTRSNASGSRSIRTRSFRAPAGSRTRSMCCRACFGSKKTSPTYSRSARASWARMIISSTG